MSSLTRTIEDVKMLSRERRLRRIAELLVKAITLHEGSLAPAKREGGMQSKPTDGERILAHLRLASASPKEIRSMIGLSRSTFNRRIAMLVAEGKVAPNGNTRGVVYRLV